MKDSKFLEQLNLYLDGEIDPADAAEFEQEILSNPARRRIYHDYCRIHRATKLVYDQFRAAGAAHQADALPPARSIASSADDAAQPVALGGRTGGRAAPRPFRRFAFASGLAAACAVGVFVGTRALSPRAPDAPAPTPTLAHTEQPAPTPQVVVEAPVAVAAPSTFKAPFAAETRQDPFVQHTTARGDPFVLTPWSVTESPVRQSPPSITNPPVLKIDPRFQTAGFGDRSETPEQRENRAFRLRLNAQPVSTTTPQPAALTTQP